MSSRISAIAIAISVLAYASDASACGGFFCSGPSACSGLFCTTAPTQQSGENLVFAIEPDGTLHVHIQILYQGESDTFAWILPLPSVPDALGVGTDDLFTQLGAQTAPQFVYTSRTDGVCRATPACESPAPPPGLYDAAFAAPRGDAAAGSIDGGSGPTIHLREEVGPYDAVVLSGSSTDELVTWLRDNSFDIPSAAEPLIGDYVAARHVFVAIRLLGGRSAGEIQPLTLHYAEGQPCVPIRMTAIAATPDMPITAYFLARARVVPDTYSLLEPAFDDVRLWDGAITYAEHVSNLIDDAGGHAFVTDYAGDVPTVSLTTRGAVDDLATQTDPVQFLSQLFFRGYASDAQLLGILPRFLPVPDGQTAQSYYQCLSQGFRSAESCGYPGTGFDPAGLAAAIEEQIRAPREEAQSMLARHEHLTRLFTTLSPDEMSLDPTFRIDDGVEPRVSNVHIATIVTECSLDYVHDEAPTHVELPSGSVVRETSGVRFRGPGPYCTARGLVPASSSATVGGGGCAASPVRRASGPVLALALLLLTLTLTKKKRTP